jgi:protoheme IX farnesyltransferase
LKKQEIHSTQTTAVEAPGWLEDVLLLTKMRLTTMVVFSAVAGYLIAAGGVIHPVHLVLLAVGGFCVTGAANAINQVLEKEYDAMMTRTAGRPVAAGRMQVSEAVVIAGLLLLVGEICLGLFNPLTAFLGMLSFTLYAFLYTPMKRYGTMSVAIGAIPGAMPVIIGCVAVQGTITWLALTLFAIQFLWQFPHFWAIGFLSFDEYRKAGFKLIPTMANGQIHNRLGWHAMVYAALLLPICGLAWWAGVTGPWTAGALLIVSAWYLQKAFQFWRAFDQSSARRLMFTSFAYLPLVLCLILIGNLIGV